FDLLKAPVQRVTGYDTVMPYAQLEKYYMPSVERVLSAVHNIVKA
ncbi:MAG TPA: transketolase C-terminal domain-containing protein, partial [Coxiellaceae bacterium]|nr:transketolase C-terminal domain-containing protein [Coxiellaceae bacterium]